MAYQERIFQTEATDNIFSSWINTPKRRPVIVLPTGAGKSVVVGKIAKRFHEDYAQYKPRGIITVPSKELCEQNTEKLANMLPGVSVDMYSASAGRKNANADIVVCTIGTVKGYPDELGHRSYWLNDECHLARTDGEGVYWRFAEGLHQANRLKNWNYCAGGLTATPFKGNGVWITDGKKPMYDTICHETPISELLKLGYLSPLVNPQSCVTTRVDTTGIKMSGDDFNLPQLVERTKEYLVSAAHEAYILAKDRMKWMAFLPDISSAADFCLILNKIGIASAVVTGETDRKEREYLISQYKAGYLRCLITVVALTTGFDVPDIDCILWLRSTYSPVLYIQGAGRGTRIHPGKLNCLWIDFTDTTERLGAIDQIRGRSAKKTQRMDAPCIVCENCGARWTPASKEVCAEYMKNDRGQFILNQHGQKILTDGCGHVMRYPDDWDSKHASNAEIMASLNPTPEYPVDSIAVRQKKWGNDGKDYLSVEFFYGMNIIVRLQLRFNEREGLTMDSRRWFNMLVGDFQKHYNRIESVSDHLRNQLIFNKTLGVKFVKIDRTQNAKYPKLLEIMR